MKCLDLFVCTLMRRTKTKKLGKQSDQRLLAENIPNILRLLTSVACCPKSTPPGPHQSDCYLCKSNRPQSSQKSDEREYGGQQKVQKGEGEEKREEQEVAKR